MNKNSFFKALVMTIIVGIILSCCGCASKEAKAVKQLIKDIGTVTLESGDDIIVAEIAYAALSDKDKDAVSNHKDLVEARDKFNDLTNRKIFSELGDKIQKKVAESHNLEFDFESDYDAASAVCNFYTTNTMEDIRDDVKYNRVSVYEASIDVYSGTVGDILSMYRTNGLMDIAVTANIYLADKETILLSLDGKSNEVTENLFQVLYDEKIASISQREDCVFHNIKWGDSYEDVLNYETAEVVTYQDDLILFSVNYEGYENSFWCPFDENGIIESALLKCEEAFYGDAYFTCYNAYKNGLTSLYGTPDEDDRIVTNSMAKYVDASGALNLGYARYRTTWTTETSDIVLVMYAEGYGDITISVGFYPQEDL